MAQSDLNAAKTNKNDEFYTQWSDIEAEVNAYVEYNPEVFKGKTILCPCDDPEWSNFTKYFAANFDRLGLKKLICTSYANSAGNRQLSLFEKDSPFYIPSKHENNGKLFVVSHDNSEGSYKTIDNVEFKGYLKGNGDFRSKEVTKLRDEADFIITNPPFSLFRDFLAWIREADKKFLIIGNISCITYKDVFPLLKSNTVWLGTGMGRWISGFIVPPEYELYGTEARIEDGKRIVSTNDCLWLTNIDHGKRHEWLQLDTMAHNLKFNKKLIKRLVTKCGVDPEHMCYPKYDNYDAIEVPYTECIPSDYTGMMAVPISFLNKYNFEQFELLGVMQRNDDPYKLKKYTPAEYKNANDLNARGTIMVNGMPKAMYARILIRAKHPEGEN